MLTIFIMQKYIIGNPLNILSVINLHGDIAFNLLSCLYVLLLYQSLNDKLMIFLILSLFVYTTPSRILLTNNLLQLVMISRKSLFS